MRVGAQPQIRQNVNDHNIVHLFEAQDEIVQEIGTGVDFIVNIPLDTGKTLTYSIPALDKIALKNDRLNQAMTRNYRPPFYGWLIKKNSEDAQGQQEVVTTNQHQHQIFNENRPQSLTDSIQHSPSHPLKAAHRVFTAYDAVSSALPREK